jgi:predicted dienelactone hydrolase
MHVGLRALAVRDDRGDVPVRVLYPSDAPPRAETFGPYAIEVATDAPIAAELTAAVAISHGKGGTPWGYRWLATHLAQHGFAVVLIEHPGNSRSDNSLDGTPANLVNRPRHVRLALDAAFAAIPTLARAAIVGHSMGAYTALAICGGRPIALPEETPERVARSIDVEHDARVRAAVLLAPAIPWFMAPGALADVHVPLLVRTGQRDEFTPPFFVENVLRNLPQGAPLDYQVVANAGHFAFFGPVPPLLANLPPGHDPPGFDRTAYQAQLRDEVLAFLRTHLA